MTTHPIIARRRRLDLDPATLRARVRAMARPALISGSNVDGPPGRWSVLAARPEILLASRSGLGYSASDVRGSLDFPGDALDGLANLLDRFGMGVEGRDRVVDLDESLPFQGGLIGHLSYDLAPRIEPVPRRVALESPIPALSFGLYDTFVLVDHERDRADLWAVNLRGEDPNRLDARLDDWADRLSRPAPLGTYAMRAVEPIPELTQADFQARIARAKRYIEAGDIFQVNLSQRFAAPGRFDPERLDDRLEAASPAPYSAYLGWGWGDAILSRSPELFYATHGRRIVTRPIKGTRPRSADPGRDAALASELVASDKDRAELTMIVDLERNDLGRVCEFGSVRVAEPRVVESYSNVHHTVATVEGRLRADAGPVDVVRALFPGGSITGAPKIRAMQIIDELEPCRRGIYTGSIGFWSANGRSSFNIAIRTVVVHRVCISYHVGGGIVADSDPEREYQETLDKGRALFDAIRRLGGDR